MKYLSSIFVAVWIGWAVPATAGIERATCVDWVERGTQVLASMAPADHGEFDSRGRPLTENAARHRAGTQAALALWQRAREQCALEAEEAVDVDTAARATALGYWAAGKLREVEDGAAAGCDSYFAGIEAVKALDPHSPHLLRLYSRVGFCLTTPCRAAPPTTPGSRAKTTKKGGRRSVRPSIGRWSTDQSRTRGGNAISAVTTLP